MEGDPPPEEASLFPATVGEKLRAAREAQGIDIADIAARTRIPQRHLEAIEKSNYSSLPSVTYALGFAKAYARAVGADEVEIARALRFELDTKFDRVAPTPAYEMEDPTRVPSRGIMWVGLLVAVLVLAGVGVWYGTNLFRGAPPAPETLEIPAESPTPETNSSAVAETGQVTLIALDTVWLRVTDANGNALFGREMKAGEQFDVPPTADHPLARTVRPDAIQVVVNGSNVPPLGPPGKDVEVEVSASALLARGQPAVTPTPGATATPAAATPATTSTPAPAATSAPRRSAPAPRPTPRATQAPAVTAPEPATVNTVTQ